MLPQTTGTARPARNLTAITTALLLGTASAVAFSSGAYAQTHTVIESGATSGPVTLDTDGDSLTVENGGAIANGFGAGVYVNGGGGAIGVGINNSGLIDGAGNYGIWAFNGGSIESLDNAETGRIQGAFQGVLVQNGNLSEVTNAGRITGIANHGIFVDTGDLTRLTNLQTGVISGAQYGVEVQSGSLAGLTNAGIIAGGSSYGILVTSGGLSDLTNTETGIIAGGASGITADTFGGFEARNIVNAGRITGNTAAGIFIDHGNLTNLTNLSTGVIDGATYGIQVDGIFTNFTNAGTVIADGNVGGLVRGLNADDVINFVNTGSLIATNPGAGDAEAVRSEAITSIINSGRIFSDLGGTNYAIHEHGAGADTDLTLLPGSLIRGRIDIEGGGAGTNRLFIGNGLSASLTFDTALPDVIQTYGALTATNGLVVATADTSAIAAEDNAVSGLMRSISGMTGQRFGQGKSLGIWTQGFGSAGSTRPAGATVGVNHDYAGALIGADAALTGNLRLGVLGGVSKGMLAAAVPYGQEISTDNYVAGVYGRFDAEQFYIGFGLTGGINVYDSTRPITNNRIGGDTIETALQTYDGYFISPEITIGSDRLELGGLPVRPSATVRYSHVHADGYDEHNVTEGDLTVGDRTTGVVDARFQVAMPLQTGIPDTLFELGTGIDGRFVVSGGTFDATLLGTTVNGFDPGGARVSAGAFAGLDFTRALSDTATMFASAELGLGTETTFRTDAELGIRIEF